jgi:hypothetical protein
MKHVVSISLGSSTRDKKVKFKLGGETIAIERIGCDGDEKKARALFIEMDGKVDAFGVGGVELYVRVSTRIIHCAPELIWLKQSNRPPIRMDGV